MRTLLHLSDLHFGQTNPEILSPLIAFIADVKPDLVAISGDFTQRARTGEYREARMFLDAILCPTIVVPGNHDIPLHNLFMRFACGLDRYRRYINDALQPCFLDEEIAVVGMNTARALAWKGGRINERQLSELRRAFERVPSRHTKVVVTHHPFDLPAGARGRVVGSSRLALRTLAQCGVDLLLSGHFHTAAAAYTVTRLGVPDYSALIVSSGTSTSTRSRGEPNSLNVIRIDRHVIAVEQRTWAANSRAFNVFSVEHFQRAGSGWIREPRHDGPTDAQQAGNEREPT